MIKYLIIDDEQMSHKIIKGYCDMLPYMQLSKQCYDAIEALEYLSKHTVDLVFLDLNMPKLKGFDFLKTLTSPPKVIVTTAYREYALEGYELNVIDYLLKPFGFERFLKAVNKAVKPNEKIQSSIETSKSELKRTLFLRSNKKHVQIAIDTILFLESDGNYTKVFTTSNIITVREKVSELLESIAHDDFVQVHRSFAVYKKYIESIEGNRIFIGKHIIPIGSSYKNRIEELLK
ncbi:DNA-binding response regulator [Tenacibaculum sp. 190130A14a]|uniref:DNA-binding response regulator n=1 Tax=Tenacibaculum polynesiense TaxID=3137857 RepID=A0ABM9P772_9FLAO